MSARPGWDWLARFWRTWSPWRPRSLGERGEAAAARWLQRRGYKIVGRQVRTAGGELDLVAIDRGTIVFVEVRTRRSSDFGAPHETIDAAKQRRVTRAALAFLKRRRLLDRPCRFDVVSIVWPEAGEPLIEHLPHAFTAEGRKSMFS